MLKIKDVQEQWRKYNGQHLYVRYKRGDGQQHFCRAKLVGVNGCTVDIQPEHHGCTDRVKPNGLRWWTSKTREHHPDFLLKASV